MRQTWRVLADTITSDSLAVSGRNAEFQAQNLKSSVLSRETPNYLCCIHTLNLLIYIPFSVSRFVVVSLLRSSL